MVRPPENQHPGAHVYEVIANADAALAVLFQQANQLARTESLLAGHCGPELAAQFQVAAMRQDRLVLLTPTAAWATRLRMQAGHMLLFLQAAGYQHLRHIDIRVAPLCRAMPEEKIRKPLSPAAQLALNQMARLTGSPPPDDQDGAEA